MINQTEDQVRDLAKEELGFTHITKKAKFGVGQLTTFNQLDPKFKGIPDKPDGWYFPDNTNDVAVILECKASDKILNKQEFIDELLKNIKITNKKYKKVVGILYNGENSIVYKNNNLFSTDNSALKNIDYYLHLFDIDNIDKQLIYTLTKRINDSLHIDFGIKNLYHRMIFTACALVAKRYGAGLVKGMNYSTFHTCIHSTLSKSLEDSRNQNRKLDLLLDVYSEIKMNSTENQEAIDNFIDYVTQISDCLNSQYWNGEDVMGIFFNEFNRYKKKSESGQVFTPDHITSFMYRLIECSKNDIILDATCGSGAFLVKAMCNMINETGGIYTEESKLIRKTHLYGIEFDREIFALACANMLIHKDGKTNLEQLDTRKKEACDWIKKKHITKVLMNPPYERKYGCMKIVKNVLDNVPLGTKCAFILPDKKLEKDNGKKLLEKHTLTTIIKMPENLFNAGITTSVYVFESGKAQNNRKIVGYYIEDDGLETVKNQGRQDIKNKWHDLEDYWINAIQLGVDDKFNTKQIIDPNEHLSYQMPEQPFELLEEDFIKTLMDYELFKQGIDLKNFKEKLITNIMYSSSVSDENKNISINLAKRNKNED